MLSVLIAGALALAAPQQQQVDTTFAVRPNGRLVVDTYSGPVVVRSSNRNEVRIQATHARGAEVDISHSGGEVSIDASPANMNMRETISITVDVPRSWSVSVDGVNAATTIESIDADVSVDIVNGGVSIRNVKGRVVADVVSGQVVIDNIRGDVTVSGSNQGMRLSNIVGDIEAENVNGSIIVTNATSTNVSAETVNGHIALGTTIRDGGRYTGATTNGTITVTIQQGANATIDASTFSGSVESQIPGVTVDRRRRGSFSTRLGNGSARIDLESFSGSITLVRPKE